MNQTVVSRSGSEQIIDKSEVHNEPTYCSERVPVSPSFLFVCTAVRTQAGSSAALILKKLVEIITGLDADVMFGCRVWLKILFKITGRDTPKSNNCIYESIACRGIIAVCARCIRSFFILKRYTKNAIPMTTTTAAMTIIKVATKVEKASYLLSLYGQRRSNRFSSTIFVLYIMQHTVLLSNQSMRIVGVIAV